MVEDLQIGREQSEIILRELEAVAGVDGDVVELGCYAGDMSVKLYKVLQRFNRGKRLWLYDSFEGLPEKGGEDASSIGANFRVGELRASKTEVVRKFKKAWLLPLPIIKKAWFEDLDAERDLPERIVFALLDGDYYGSIMTSLKLVVPRMSEGGTIIVHDYQNEALPGARRAVDEFLRGNGRYSMRVQCGLAIIKLKSVV